MASKSALVAIVGHLGRSEASVVITGLTELHDTCCCKTNSDNGSVGNGAPSSSASSSCGIQDFVATSPQCLELLRIWAGTDPLLSSGFMQSGLFPSAAPAIVFDSIEEEKKKKKSFFHVQRAHLLSRLMDCFALILEHASLDIISPSTAQSRQNLSHRLLSACLRSLYRLIQYVDKTRDTQRSIARLLASLQTVSVPITTQFLNEFNFSLSGFHRLSEMIEAPPPQMIKSLVHSGSDLISLGVLGHSIHSTQEIQRCCRSHLLRMFRLLLETNDDSLTLKVLEIRNFTSRVTRFLYMDTPSDCLSILRCLYVNFFCNNWLSRPARARLCRAALLSDLARLLSVYATVVEGRQAAQRNYAVGVESPKIAESREVKDNPETKGSLEAEIEIVSLIEKIFLIVLGPNGLLSCSRDSSNTLLEICSNLPFLHLPSFQRIVIVILSAHPTLMPSLITNLQMTAGIDPQPRLTAVWLRTAGFTAQLLDLTQTVASTKQWGQDDEMIDDEPKSLQDVVKSCCLGNMEDPKCGGRELRDAEYWLERIRRSNLHQDGQELLSLVVAGNCRLLTRPILTSAILSDYDEIVFTGLILIARVCRCLSALESSMAERPKRRSSRKEDVISERPVIRKGFIIIEAIRKEVMNRLPEVSTLIRVLQRFGTHEQFQKRMSEPNVLHSKLVPFDQRRTAQQEKSTVPFEELDAFEFETDTTLDSDEDDSLIENVEEEDGGKKNEERSKRRKVEKNEDDDIIIPGLIDGNMNNLSSSQNQSSVLALKELHYDLGELMEIFKDKYDDHILLKRDSACLYSQWCTTMTAMLRCFPLSPALIKFDWSRIIQYSWPLPESSNVDHSSHILRFIVTIQTLDSALGLQCCPTENECQEFEKQADGESHSDVCTPGLRSSDGATNHQRAPPFEMKMMRYYLIWLKGVIELWGYSINKETNFVPQQQKFIRRCQTFCRLTVERFFKRSLFFTCGSWDESAVWASQLELSNHRFAQFIFAVLRNVANHLILFTEAATREMNPPSSVTPSSTEDHLSSSPLSCLPLSIFTIGVILHWRKNLSFGLAPRHVHLDLPKLRYWTTPDLCSAAERRRHEVLGAVECCRSMAQCVKTICLYRGEEATCSVRALCSNGRWKNIFVDPRTTQDTPRTVGSLKNPKNDGDDDAIVEALEKAKSVISTTRRELKSLDSPCITSSGPPSLVTVVVGGRERKRSERDNSDDIVPAKKSKRDDRRDLESIEVNPNMLYDDTSSNLIIQTSLIAVLKDLGWEKCDKFDVAGAEFVNRLANMKAEEFLKLFYDETGAKIVRFVGVVAQYGDASLDSDQKQITAKALSLLVDLSEKLAMFPSRESDDANIVESSIDSLLNLWVLLIGIRDQTLEWDDSRSEPLKKKAWSRQRKNKGKSALEVSDLLFSCPFIKAQFDLHFPWTTSKKGLPRNISKKGLPTSSQTALVHLLAFIHQFRVSAQSDSTIGSSSAPIIDATTTAIEILPPEWTDVLLYWYSGSMSDFDRCVRILLVDPPKLEELELTEWMCKVHDFREIHCFDSRPDKNEPSFRSSGVCDWLGLDSQRLAVTLSLYPIHRKFSSGFSTESPFVSLDHNTHRKFSDDQKSSLQCSGDGGSPLPKQIAGAELVDVPGMRAGVGMSGASASWLVYDPASLLPFLAGRMRAAWIIVEEERRNLRKLSGGPIHHLLEFPYYYKQSRPGVNEDDEEEVRPRELTEKEMAYKKILKSWRSAIDLEGVWLRRVAVGGTLEMLIMGLTCSDVVLRSAAVEGMGLYRSLLVTAESDATVRAERYRRFKFRKEAIRNVKESIIKECLMRGLETRQPTDDEVKDETNRLAEAATLTVRHPFKELREVLTLLELLKSSIEIDRTKSNCSGVVTTPLPPIIGALAVACLPILLDATHPLYIRINGYLATRPALIRNDVPLFMSLFWSDRHDTLQMERGLAAKVLHLAINSGSDEVAIKTWGIMSRRGVLPLLLDTAHHYSHLNHLPSNSNSTDRFNFWSHTAACLLKLTRRSCKDDPHEISAYLVTQYALLEWIDLELRTLANDILAVDDPNHEGILSLNRLRMQSVRLESILIILGQLALHPKFVRRDGMNVKADVGDVDDVKMGKEVDDMKIDGVVDQIDVMECRDISILLQHHSSRYQRRIESLMAIAATLLFKLKAYCDKLLEHSDRPHSVAELCNQWKPRWEVFSQLIKKPID